MIVQLLSLTIIAIVGGIAGFHYARLEREKKARTGQLRLPYANDDREPQQRAIAH